ncbi:MAG: efflux RND transporter periplasmic adaptor subunit [Chloroflexi bacterium]|nr:efflux RND transporter periplasmic adaptor subunit [Chloroflexota bacterium]
MAMERELPRAQTMTGRSRSRGRKGLFSRTIVLLIALLGSIAIGYVGYQQLRPAPAPVARATTMPVRRGTITATVNTTGSMAAISQANLAFQSAGKLTELLVKVGSNVKQGDVLARLDSSDLELQVAQAEIALEQARLKLAQLKEGPKAVDVAAAQANYDSAVTKYDDLKGRPKAEDIDAARAAVRNAEVALANIQDSLILTQKSDTVSKNFRDRENEHNWYEARYGETLAKFKQGGASQADVDRDWSNLLTAKERLDSARANAEIALRKAENDVSKAKEDSANAQDNLQKIEAGPTQDQLKTAEAAMLQAKSQLETKTAGASPTDIATQEVAVRLAEATLSQKQQLLQKAPLIAPFDGVIDSISVNVGEQVTASKAVMIIVNLNQFRIDARVDESDVASIVVGQPALVGADALPNQNMTARVSFIGAIPTTSQGVVLYPVTLELDPTNVPIRPGMTANVAVEITRRENILLVPNRAVRSQGRNRVVEVMVDGKPESRTVTVGMSNDQFTEVSNGLQEGDTVVLPTTTTTAPRVPGAANFGGMPGGMPGGIFVAPGR